MGFKQPASAIARLLLACALSASLLAPAAVAADTPTREIVERSHERALEQTGYSE